MEITDCLTLYAALQQKHSHFPLSDAVSAIKAALIFVLSSSPSTVMT